MNIILITLHRKGNKSPKISPRQSQAFIEYFLEEYHDYLLTVPVKNLRSEVETLQHSIFYKPLLNYNMVNRVVTTQEENIRVTEEQLNNLCNETLKILTNNL